MAHGTCFRRHPQLAGRNRPPQRKCGWSTNHPDVAYAFVKTLNDCGYRWLLVQEHTIELPDGGSLERPHRRCCI
jgi:hypothetical protein